MNIGFYFENFFMLIKKTCVWIENKNKSINWNEQSIFHKIYDDLQEIKID
jgi:hypothetical protein